LIVRAVFLVSSFEEIMMSGNTKELVTKSKWPMLLMALVGGMVSGIQISVMKGLMICVGLSSPFSHYQTYIFIIFCAFVVIYQLKIVNQALEFYPTVMTLPMYNSFVTLCNFLCGAVILNEKDMYTEGELSVQILLCGVCLVGIYILIAKANLF